MSLIAVDRDAPASVVQEERARYLPRLREPLQQLEFVIDGERLSLMLRHLPVPQPEIYGLATYDFLSVGDLAWPQEAASSLRQVAGVEERAPEWPLAPGRFPLYVCPLCADLACGAITVEIVRDERTVTWRDFRMENGYSDDATGIDLGAMPEFTFDADQYRMALLQSVPLLRRLAEQERVAEGQWRRSSGIRGRVRRLLHR